ncbi:MAG: hypothetical protein U0235_28450 [Polyangiaceae bacterium]
MAVPVLLRSGRGAPEARVSATVLQGVAIPGSGAYGLKVIRRVLLVGASEIQLARMKRALSESGYDVLTATHVVGSSRVLSSCDLIVFDVEVPGLTPTAIESYRSVLYAARKKCLVYLHVSEATSAIGYRDAGFDGFFHGRGDEHALVRQVDALSGRNEASAARG